MLPHRLPARADPAARRPPVRSGWKGPLQLQLQRLLPMLLLACLLAGPVAARAQVEAQAIETALSAEGDTARFPDAAPARPVALPDDWSRTRPGSAGPVWYRVDFDLAAPVAAPLLAVQMAQVCATFELQLNGQLLHRGGRMDEPYTLDCDQPQLLALPAALLRAGSNRLDLKVVGYPLAQVGSRHRAAALSALAIGPLDMLQARQRWQTAIQVTLPQALGATLLLMGGFMFVLGFFNRRESHLAYFGALSLGWALLGARLWVHEWPLPHATVEWLLCALLPLTTWAAVQFLLRYAHWRHAAIDIALPLQALLMPLTLLAAGTQHLYPLAMAWALLLALQVLGAAVFYLHRQWRDRSASFWLMGALLAVVAVSGAIELAAQMLGTPPAAAQLARLATPLMLVLVGLRLVQQHGQARQQAEAGRAQLEQRVREATAEIERNFRQLSELKIEQVTERERKRIAADLHDDLGAKLLTIVHTSESDRISTLAREALEEMRLSVRGLTGRAVRLADALGDWRAEVVSRLAQAGIEADWSAPDDLPQTLSARAYVQTTRILREATSNIIKHSGASHCAVHCQVADGDFQLVVQDNGEGITPEADGRLDRGHGMATMKQRAKQLQGQCLVESGPGYGTVIRLTLPLDRALESA
ncbi:MAG: sensor histidine kinase [Rubrivivax sp.]|nr:sensor histidine kinase [Rubrivivax sp.]